MDDKPVKHIELNHHEWEDLRKRIKQDYGASTVMISWKLKETLGFTVREHFRWDDTHAAWADRRSVICLDFYDVAMKSWFILKYQ